MKDLLEHSLALYQNLASKTREIESALDAVDPVELTRLAEESASIMDEVRLCDEQLFRIADRPSTGEELSLYTQRVRLIENLLAKNRELEPRLQGLRALKMDELHQVKHGRTTVKGYAHYATKAGRIINTAK